MFYKLGGFILDFSNKNLWVLFEWNGDKFYVTQSILSTWIVMAVLVILAVIVRIRLRKFKSIPSGFQNLIETVVEMMSNFTKTTIENRPELYEGYFFSIFAFILFSNYSGLLGLRPPTSDLATTAALGISTFLIVHITGITFQGGKYFKEYFSPHPIFFPINVVSELSKPISLSFRLFGNILGGVIIVGLIYNMVPVLLRFVLPTVIHVYFDVFVGALQAFIFTVLSMTFVSQKALVD